MMEQKIYLGSVTFFKHLIYLKLFLLGVAALCGLYSAAKGFVAENSFVVLSSNRFVDYADAAKESKQKEQITTYHPDYQSRYPELYCTTPDAFHRIQEKVAYLTFDDGPSVITTQILDILKKRNIKATFFVVTNITTASFIISYCIKLGRNISM